MYIYIRMHETAIKIIESINLSLLTSNNDKCTDNSSNM